MTELQMILEELNEIKKLCANLAEALALSRTTYFENLPPGAVVGREYVAYRFDCIEDAVVRGRFGTDKIRRVRNSPVKFIKREVDAVWQNLNQPVAEKAAKYRHKAKTTSKAKKRVPVEEDSDADNTNE